MTLGTRLLLANHQLKSRGGTEVWTKLMGEYLSDMGYDVYLKTLDGEAPLIDLPYDDGGEYDIAIINHLEPDEINAKFKIFTSHGVIPTQEISKPGADVYVGVSEEVAKVRKYDHIIRNPIDTDLFKPTKPVNKELTNILVISNNPINKQLVENACVGYNLRFIGGENRVDNPQDHINWADLVITLGRGCYEALACNRNVLIYDYNGGDGMVNKTNIYEYRKNNCSGRYNRYKWTAEQLKQQLNLYNPDLKMRDYILKEHSVKSVVDSYLSLLPSRL